MCIGTSQKWGKRPATKTPGHKEKLDRIYTDLRARISHKDTSVQRRIRYRFYEIRWVFEYWVPACAGTSLRVGGVAVEGQ